jgi:hypothetical protein
MGSPLNTLSITRRERGGLKTWLRAWKPRVLRGKPWRAGGLGQHLLSPVVAHDPGDCHLQDDSHLRPCHGAGGWRAG